MQHSAQFMDLVAACAQFVATVGRIVPGLKGEQYDGAEGDSVERGLRPARLPGSAGRRLPRGEPDPDPHHRQRRPLPRPPGPAPGTPFRAPPGPGSGRPCPPLRGSS
ncbi:DUF6192 family protein [Streptomyces clavuligerus]|uniref:DUF6192 family protein n=2 Tax=Streptomyces clavuligerus TaxID=1901 RepID=UPI0034D5A112